MDTTDKKKKRAQKDDEAEEETTEWQAVFDETSQAWYWWNTISGETTWDDPNIPEEEKARAKELAASTSEQEVSSTTVAEVEAVEAEEGEVAATAGEGADYYNSQEYYDWYYAQMAAATAAGDGKDANAVDPAGTAAAYAAYATYGAIGMPPIPGIPFTSFQATTAGEHFNPGDITLSATFNQKTGRFQPDRAGGDSYFNPNAKAERQMAHFFDIDQYQEERNMMRQQEAMNPQTKKKLTKKDIDRFKKKNKEKKLRSLLKRFGPDD